MKQENNSDFSHNNSSAEIKPSKHRFTKILIPVVSFCILSGTAAITIPIVASKNSQQKELVFDTSLDEFLSCCFNYSFHRNADAEPPPKTTVTSIYDAYRNNFDWMNEIRKTCETYTLHEEKAYHCVYAKKEICDIVNEIDHSDYYSFPQTPISGTTVFVDLCKYGPLDFETESKLLKERIYPDDSIYVDFQIDDDYYLLDVVKYYKDPNYNNYFVDFTNFSIDGQNAFLDIGESHLPNRYLFCFLEYPFMKLSSELAKKGFKYYYKHTLDYFSLEVVNRDKTKVIEDEFSYCLNYESDYYNDINRCIIGKDYQYSKNDNDYYDVVFDYQQLVKLFGFMAKW